MKVTIDRTVHRFGRRWYWEVLVPDALGAHGEGGWTLTRAGARFAAWRCTRRGVR